MLEEDDIIIGGPSVVVQVDETKLGKRKYNRGHRVAGAWVVVGVEKTAERRVFAEVVANRSCETIEGVLERHIAEGTILHTDMWKGYSNLSTRFNIEHHTVNHSRWFKDPVTGINTNTVEGTNYAIKRSIEPRNRTEESLPSRLVEFVWRRKFANNIWEGFLDALREVVYT
jgi:transposase-like protein